MEKIIFLNVDSLFSVLFWGNLISFLVLFIYYCQDKFSRERNILIYLINARLCHAFHYFVVSGRGIFPDWLSVNFGISMLFIGCLFEALAIMRIIKGNTSFTDRLLWGVTLLTFVFFNALEFVMPYGGIRIVMASGGNLVIMLPPIACMLFARDSSVFARFIAIFYSIFLLLLLGRVYFGLYNQNTSVLTTNVLNSLTFLALLLQLIIALPAYILILKSYTEEALRLMATTDKLTGATNRHAFLDAAIAIYKNRQALRQNIALLFADIDYFKLVNDRYGHNFGDIVLARLARIIDTCLRGSDLSCRYGGEEFVMLLPYADYSAAKIVTQRIMNEVRAARFEEQPDFSFTVSIGVVYGVPGYDQNFKAAIQAADEAMYQAKKAGRNRVIFTEMDNNVKEKLGKRVKNLKEICTPWKKQSSCGKGGLPQSIPDRP